MQTTYFPPDVLIIPELDAAGSFRTLKVLVSRKRLELEKARQGIELRKIVLSRTSLRHLIRDPDLLGEAKAKDPGGVRLKLPDPEILGAVLGGIMVDVVDGPMSAANLYL